LLSGGLGNQLFQAGAAKKFAPGVDIQLLPYLGGAVLNRLGAPEITDFDIESEGMCVSSKTFTRVQKKMAILILRMSSVESSSHLKKFLAIVIKILLQKALGLLLGERIQSPQGIGFDSNFVLNPRTTMIIGNFHSYKMIDEMFVSRISLKNIGSELFNEYIDALDNSSITGIHVRLGDYLRIDELNVLGATYYADSLRNMKSRGIDNPIYVFTNDHEYVNPYLPSEILEKVHFVASSLSSAETLMLMRKCNVFVVANSTFSWWGACKSFQEGNTVFAPSKWFKNRPNPIEMCPPSWITIKNE
jgi:hypothetical protein